MYIYTYWYYEGYVMSYLFTHTDIMMVTSCHIYLHILILWWLPHVTFIYTYWYYDGYLMSYLFTHTDIMMVSLMSYIFTHTDIMMVTSCYIIKLTHIMEKIHSCGVFFNDSGNIANFWWFNLIGVRWIFWLLAYIIYKSQIFTDYQFKNKFVYVVRASQRVALLL